MARKKKYEYVIVERYYDQVYVRGPKGQPLTALCAKGFEEVFHWVPEKLVKYKMWLYFDAEEV